MVDAWCILYTKEGIHGIFWQDKSNSFLSSILLVVVINCTVVMRYDNFERCLVAIFRNHALLFDPLVCELCWWLPPESEVLKQ
ncbi:hypothetical protein Tco_0421564 [Tanacetum coccineum]